MVCVGCVGIDLFRVCLYVCMYVRYMCMHARKLGYFFKIMQVWYVRMCEGFLKYERDVCSYVCMYDMYVGYVCVYVVSCCVMSVCKYGRSVCMYACMLCMCVWVLVCCGRMNV